MNDRVACISCGAVCAENGGLSTASTPAEPICMECVNIAQGKMQRMHVYVAIDGERAYQDKKHGAHKHTIMEWLSIMGSYADKANQVFVDGGQDCQEQMLHNIRKLVASGVCCMEQNGVVSRACDSAVSIPDPVRDLLESPEEEGFRKLIESAINRYSRENGSNTPDFILANYLLGALELFDATTQDREKWYGREPKPVDGPVPPPPDQAYPVNGLSVFEGGHLPQDAMKVHQFMAVRCDECGHSLDHPIHKLPRQEPPHPSPVGKPFLTSI